MCVLLLHFHFWQKSYFLVFVKIALSRPLILRLWGSEDDPLFCRRVKNITFDQIDPIYNLEMGPIEKRKTTKDLFILQIYSPFLNNIWPKHIYDVSKICSMLYQIGNCFFNNWKQNQGNSFTCSLLADDTRLWVSSDLTMIWWENNS